MQPTHRGMPSVLAISLLLTAVPACTGQADERRPQTGRPAGGPQSSGAPARSAPRLAEVLTKIERNAATEAFLEYGDQETIRRLAGSSVQWARRFTRLDMVGAPQLTVLGRRLAEPTGIDVGQVRIAYSTGRIPQDAGLLSGRFDPATTDRRLAALRYRRDPQDDRTWVLKDFGGLGSGHPLARLGVTSWFDAVRITGTDVAHARTTAALSQVTPAAARPRLDGSPPHRAVAGCLGDPIAARIRTPSPAARAGAKGAAAIKLTGVGVLAGTADNVQEVLCYRTTGDAAALAEKLGDTMREGTSRRMGKPWRELLAEPRTETLPGGVVRLTTRLVPGVPAGVLLTAVTEFDLPGVTRTS